MPVTSMQPGRKVLGTLISREVGLGVGPLAQRGLDEALGLAIGFRRVGLGAQVLDFEQPQCLRVTTGSEAGAVVGHDAIDLDAMGPEEAQRVKEKAQAGSTFFIGQDFPISGAGGVGGTRWPGTKWGWLGSAGGGKAKGLGTWQAAFGLAMKEAWKSGRANHRHRRCGTVRPIWRPSSVWC